MSKAISLPFSFDADGRVSSTTDITKIIQDRVVLAVMTSTTERIMRPGYGSNVKTATFENTSIAIGIVEQEVSAAFSNWLPYLKLINVNVTLDVDNYLNITIDYQYGALANTETVIVKTATLTQSGDIITEVPYGQ